MKKLFAIIVAAALCLGLAAPAFAADDLLISPAPADGVNVYVTIVDAGDMALIQAPVYVTDVDTDGALTINDALIAAHTKYYKDGADGFVTHTGDYGLAIDKLWGVENGGSYMYYLNDGMAWSLVDPISEGAYITAYGFQDLEGWSDVYTFFDKPTATVAAGGTIELTLKGYDWMLDPNGGASPMANVNIYVDGEAVGTATDSEGKVSITLGKVGTYAIYAISDTAFLTPAICTVKVGFADVPADEWYTAAVNFCYSNGWIVGESDSAFCPAANMSAAQYMTIIYRMGVMYGIYDGTLATEGENWQEAASVINADCGIAIADLNADIRRDEMAYVTAYLLRKLGITGGNAEAFTDSAESAYAEAIEYIHSVGAVDGYEDNSFRPAASIERSEAAQVIYKMANILPEV
ncbi:MAG: S-layer homology domain-containing protein [Clostridiales bacterium]|nr:S-layer homology domain-containing protein [Clostridiales bacterium]